ncbi:MerR family DNA-binding transcriptional regulator [Candidatus Giovannonibacteria bacterium]|nr:MerR family DNA-binding transcriptional regulator [Candidatus Giovannonibacteria bacterium]
MNDSEASKFINIKAAAKLLGVSALTLRNWDKKKKLVAFRHPINNYRVYKYEDIQTFLAKIEDTNKPKKVRIEFLGDDMPEESTDDQLENEQEQEFNI